MVVSSATRVTSTRRAKRRRRWVTSSQRSVAAATLLDQRVQSGGLHEGALGRRFLDGCGGIHGEIQPLGTSVSMLPHGECRVADRAIAGAAAEVAAQGRFEPLGGQRSGPLLLLLVQGEERHHDAWSTEAALAGVAGHHGGLGGVEGLAPGEPLHGDKRKALELVGGGDAGVGAVVVHPAVGAGLANGHGTGAAVAGGAPLLGAGLAQGLAQQLEHAGIGRGLAMAGLPVEQEVDHGVVSVIDRRVLRPVRGASLLTMWSGCFSAWPTMNDFASRPPATFAQCRRIGTGPVAGIALSGGCLMRHPSLHAPRRCGTLRGYHWHRKMADDRRGEPYGKESFGRGERGQRGDPGAQRTRDPGGRGEGLRRPRLSRRQRPGHRRGGGAAQVQRALLHGSKRGLYVRLLERMMARWNALLDDISVEDDPAEVLEAFIRSKMALSRRHPEGSRLFAAEILAGAPFLQEYLSGELRD